MAHSGNEPKRAQGLRRKGSGVPDRGGRKDDSHGSLGFRLSTLLAVFALCLGGIAWKTPRDEILLPIRYVRVEGPIQHLDVAGLRQALLPAASAGYVSLDLRAVEAVAKSLPWVDGVQAVRVWPDTLVLRINEHQAVARWGKHALLNQRGESFAPGAHAALPQLPVIYGPTGMENYLLSTLNKLNSKLKNQGMSVAALDLSKRRAWMARLTGGMEIHFGRQDPLEAMDRFLQFVPRLGEERMADIQRLDMRYPNGFAVVWKSEGGSADNSPQQAGRRDFIRSAMPLT